MTAPATGAASKSKRLLVAVVVSVIAGGITGFATSYALSPARPAAQDRTFYLFTSVLDFDEANASLAFGTDVPHDYFNPDRITVDKGDRVTIRYYNAEDEPENHTFTMNYSKYSFDYTVEYHQKQDVVFTADVAGVFAFECTLHQPTMTGYLAVLG